MSRHKIPDGNRRLAKVMRRQMTPSEFRLWAVLKDEELHGQRFRRQVPVGGYVLDFLCPAARLVIEIDGGQHYSGAGESKDAVRSRWLENQKYLVLRFSNRDVAENLPGVWETIRQALDSRLPPGPSPKPADADLDCPVPRDPSRT